MGIDSDRIRQHSQAQTTAVPGRDRFERRKVLLFQYVDTENTNPANRNLMRTSRQA